MENIKEFTIADLDKEMLKNGDWTLFDYIHWYNIQSNDLKIRYDKTMKKYTKEYSIIGTEWTCPRCNKTYIITKNGIDHCSNKHGAHFFKHTLSDLINIKEIDNELNKIWYGK